MEKGISEKFWSKKRTWKKQIRGDPWTKKIIWMKNKKNKKAKQNKTKQKENMTEILNQKQNMRKKNMINILHQKEKTAKRYIKRKKRCLSKVEKFCKQIRQGPCFIFTMCNRCFYQCSFRLFEHAKYDILAGELYCPVRSFDEKIYICDTCHI